MHSQLGHCYAAHMLGQPVHGILFWPLGGLATIGKSATPYGACRQYLQLAYGGCGHKRWLRGT